MKKKEKIKQMNRENELEINLLMTFHFDNRSDRLFLAFLYPFTYTEHLAAINRWETEFARDESVYFRKEVLVKSVENRNVYLLTITENSTAHASGREQAITDLLFPEKKERPLKYLLISHLY